MIHYASASFHLEFSQPISFTSPPAFLFRGLLGNALRRMVCVMGGADCSSCLLKSGCAYAWFFESHIPRENTVLAGINRASHPFILSVKEGTEYLLSSITLDVTFFGKGIDYLPYIFLALRKAGESGILRDRIPFNVVDVTSQGLSLLKGDSLTPLIPQEFSLSTVGRSSSKELLIRSQSPWRLQKREGIMRQATYNDLLDACLRRVRLLEGFYGITSAKGVPDSLGKKKTKASFHFSTQNRYSGRQKKVHPLGGIEGILEVEGDFSSFELSLLKAGELFHIGKNTAFGLGKYKIYGL